MRNFEMEPPYRLPLLIGRVAENCPGSPKGGADGCPGLLEKSVRGLLSAGADALLAPTFCANRAVLADLELAERTVSFNRILLERTRETAGRAVPVGGTVGPSGLFPPPFGETDFDDLYEIYREQICALSGAGADFLMLDRQSSLADMRAALLAARTVNLPVFITVAVDADGKTLTGGEFLPALITLQAMGADAVGIAGPLEESDVRREILRALPHASVPLIFCPEGESALSPSAFAECARPLVEAGIRIAEAGSEIGAQQLRPLGKLLHSFGPPVLPDEPDCRAAAIEREAFFLGEDLSFSKPIPCTSSLADDLIDLDDEQVSAALVEVASVGDAELLGQCSPMTKLPVAVRTDSLTVLDAALRYFQGRLIIDSSCLEDRENAEPLAVKYGAVLY